MVVKIGINLELKLFEIGLFAGTVSKGYFQQSGIKSNRGDELENGLWDMIDFFMKKFLSFDGVNFGDDVRGKKDIFVKTLSDLQALKRRFLMIAVMTDLTELNVSFFRRKLLILLVKKL